MRTSKFKCLLFSAILALGAGALVAHAHESDGDNMMSSEGMKGGMMSKMSPEDQKAMTEACMNMMQGHMQSDEQKK